MGPRYSGLAQKQSIGRHLCAIYMTPTFQSTTCGERHRSSFQSISCDATTRFQRPKSNTHPFTCGDEQIPSSRTGSHGRFTLSVTG